MGRKMSESSNPGRACYPGPVKKLALLVALAMLARRGMTEAPRFVASVRSEMARLRRRESALSEAADTLGVAPGADASGVRSAYRRRARAFHPDLHPGDPVAAGSFLAVTAARDILLCPPPLLPRRVPGVKVDKK